MIFQVVNTISYLLASAMAWWAWHRLQSSERLLCITVWLATFADLSGHLLHAYQFWLRIDLNVYNIVNLAVWLTYFWAKQLLNRRQAIWIFSVVMLAFVAGKLIVIIFEYLNEPSLSIIFNL